MSLPDARWHAVSPSPFEHEQQGLDILREVLPDESPFHVWTNFEFPDEDGQWHEVDALVLARTRFILVELKYYSGVLRGTGLRWERPGHSPQRSPLALAKKKAERFRALLVRTIEATQPGAGRQRIVPYVDYAVFLHHPRFRNEMAPEDSGRLYGLPRNDASSNLPSMEHLVLAPASERFPLIGEPREQVLVALMDHLKLADARQPEVGSWLLEERLGEPTPDGQDWLASHRFQERHFARIRFQQPREGAPSSDLARVREAARREFDLTRALHHEGLLTASDRVDNELGVGLVFPYDESLAPLPLWLESRAATLSQQNRFDLLRQLAETLEYVHSNGIVHRALSPEALWVKTPKQGEPRILVADWQLAGVADRDKVDNAASLTQLSTQFGTTVRSTEELAPTSAALFRAPEDARRVSSLGRYKLDVFSVGALAAYLLTGAPAANTVAELHGHLATHQGLDVSVALPSVPEPVRQAILHATDPRPTARTATLNDFLAGLTEAQATAPQQASPALDPLEATPGQALDSRFTLVRRLGKGSTAVGLLVDDAQTGSRQVLKVALDDEAATRLDDEAQVLRLLPLHKRLVRLLDGPFDVGGRRALLLTSAGTRTLSEVLRERQRLSLDHLERFGSELLEAAQALDAAGLRHRDVKPANIGVVRTPKHGEHLVLFDFSLARARSTDVRAGTPPYLDPFLEQDGRTGYDSAAELYAVAVVLYEMASGQKPFYGDPEANPAAVRDDLTVPDGIFDPSLQAPLTALFERALARDAQARFHTVAELAAAWEALFRNDADPVTAQDAETLAARATLETPLSEAGLSARGLSALEAIKVTAGPGGVAVEPHDVRTVRDLVLVDPIKLNSLAGSTTETRAEVRARAKQWRAAFKKELVRQATQVPQGTLPTPLDAAELLLRHAGAAHAEGVRAQLRLVLGLDGEVPALSTHAVLADARGVTPGLVPQLFGRAQQAWTDVAETRSLLDSLDGALRAAVAERGGVATPDELTSALEQALSPATPAEVRDAEPRRIVQGLLWLLLDRERAAARGEADVPALVQRRREGRVVAVAETPVLLDVAETLGAAAEAAVDGAGDPESALVPADLVQTRVMAVLDAVDGLPEALRSWRRAAALAAHVSATACLSAAGEWHHRLLAPATAAHHALQGASGTVQLSRERAAERVGARFPALSPLPRDAALDRVLAEAELGLVFDENLGPQGAYRSRQTLAPTTGFATRAETRLVEHQRPLSELGVEGQRLLDSQRNRSYLALGVPAQRLARLESALVRRFHVEPLDLTDRFIRLLKDQAAAHPKMTWDHVTAADAEPAGSRQAQGLNVLVRNLLPELEQHLSRTIGDPGRAASPVLLTGAAVLARYGHLGVLARWADLAEYRARPVWLVVPQVAGNVGPRLDGVPVPKNTPGQYVPLTPEWIDGLAALMAAQPLTEESRT